MDTTAPKIHLAITLPRDGLLAEASSAMWALRLAAGTSRLRLIRQPMAESLLAVAAGCAAGIAPGRPLKIQYTAPPA